MGWIIDDMQFIIVLEVSNNIALKLLRDHFSATALTSCRHAVMMIWGKALWVRPYL